MSFILSCALASCLLWHMLVVHRRLAACRSPVHAQGFARPCLRRGSMLQARSPFPARGGQAPPRLVRLYASIGRPCYGCCTRPKLSLKAPCCGVSSCLSHAPHASRAQDLLSVQTDVPGKNSGSPLEYCTNSAVPQGCKEGLQP